MRRGLFCGLQTGEYILARHFPFGVSKFFFAFLLSDRHGTGTSLPRVSYQKRKGQHRGWIWVRLDKPQLVTGTYCPIYTCMHYILILYYYLNVYYLSGINNDSVRAIDALTYTYIHVDLLFLQHRPTATSSASPKCWKDVWEVPHHSTSPASTCRPTGSDTAAPSTSGTPCQVRTHYMGGYVGGWMDKWVGGWISGWMDRQTDVCMHAWMDGWMDG